ncbi:MAG: lactate utilization protein LutB domain-containing protein, partial [Prochlorococcus sp.]
TYQIPHTKLMLSFRETQHRQQTSPATARLAISGWAWLARHPRLYQLGSNIAIKAMSLIGGKRGRLHNLPVGRGWTLWRDLPAPEGSSFQQQWAQQKHRLSDTGGNP